MLAFAKLVKYRRKTETKAPWAERKWKMRNESIHICPLKLISASQRETRCSSARVLGGKLAKFTYGFHKAKNIYCEAETDLEMD